MKVTINQVNEVEIELPLYFKTKQFGNIYFMIVGNKSAVKVSDYEFMESLSLMPKIEMVELSHVGQYFVGGIEPISETMFKLKFTEVTNRIESLLN